LLTGTAIADGPPAKGKDPYPEVQQDVIDRLEAIQTMYREAGHARFAFQRQAALDRTVADAKALRADLTKRMTREGLADWVATVTAIDEDNVHFDVGPGLTLKVGRPGMDGLTILAVRKLAPGNKVTFSLAPVLIADVQGEGTRFVAAVGGKHLTLKSAKPK
jgi:hypothetical protein